MAVGVGVTPVPERATVCGLPAALSATDIDPDLAPLAVGVNVTLIVQVAATPRLPGQLLVCEKSPVAVIEVIANEAEPLLVSTTGCDALLVPVNWLAKFRLVGLNDTDGAGVLESSKAPSSHGPLPGLGRTVRITTTWFTES